MYVLPIYSSVVLLGKAVVRWSPLPAPRPVGVNPWVCTDSRSFHGFHLCFAFSHGSCLACRVSWVVRHSKHGRICMLACLGLLVQEFFTFPFYKNAPHLATAGHDYGVKVGGMVHILIGVIIFEALTTPAIVQMINGGDRQPGYFGFDPLKLGKNPSFAVNEVKNGRLAMIGIGGMIHQVRTVTWPLC